MHTKKLLSCPASRRLTAARFRCLFEIFTTKNIRLHYSGAVNRIVFHLCMSPDLAFITFSCLPKGHIRLVCRALSGFGEISRILRAGYSLILKKRSFLTVAGPRRILTCFHLSLGQFHGLCRLWLVRRTQMVYVLFTVSVYHRATRFGKENFREPASLRFREALARTRQPRRPAALRGLI